MYVISTSIELPIAHCLYKGAYSGLCCGNVYRDKDNDSENDRYDLSTNIFPIIHGHNYIISVSVITDDNLDTNNMVIDFKLLKKIINNYFSQYDHSLILTPDNPLTKAYINNYQKYGIDINRSRLFIWDVNPTAEYMAKYWCDELKVCLQNFINFISLEITVEETSHNRVIYKEQL